MPLEVPCGQCIGCRLERSRQWAIRCVHEASLHENKCFITLTFNNENLDSSGSLVKSDFQKFMKRLRKKYGENIRYFHCGEYGTDFGRPHHHACIFGFDFPDKEIHKITKSGDKLYRANSLEKLWKHGFSTIGEVTFDSAAYVARYITKKINGIHAPTYYNTIDNSTGEILNERIPEYTTQSNRPGIEMEWYEKYKKDIYKDDFIVLNGKKMKPPKFYDKKYEIDYPDDLFKLKSIRKKLASNTAHNTPERLAVREKIQLKRATSLIRSVENEN